MYSIITFSKLNSSCDFLCELHRSETWDVICGVRCARPGYVVWLCTKTLSYWNTVGICHAQHSLWWNQVMFCRLLVFFAASLAASGYVWCYRRYVCLSLCLTVFAAKSAVPLNVRMSLCSFVIESVYARVCPSWFLSQLNQQRARACVCDVFAAKSAACVRMHMLFFYEWICLLVSQCPHFHQVN